jgi:hypothetical protein
MSIVTLKKELILEEVMTMTLLSMTTTPTMLKHVKKCFKLMACQKVIKVQRLPSKGSLW